MSENTSLPDLNNISVYDEDSCSGASEDDMLFYETFSWWTDGVLLIAIGITGFVANAVTIIPLLLSKKLSSIFNRLLICLAVFDNLFLTSCILEAVRRFFIRSNVQVIAFVYFFYQLQAISLMSSMTTTVVLAVERFLAVTRPVEYHLAVVAAATSPWRRVMQYMVPTVVFCILFNLPKFFELEVSYEIMVQDEVNVTLVNYQPTDLRLNKNYSLFYVHLVRLFVTGVIPFAALVWLNRGIFCAVRRSRRQGLASRTTNDANAKHEKEETRRAIVLFVIVVMFLVCNTPRIMLNFYEFFSIDAFRKNRDNETGCNNLLPLWVMVMTSVSLLLMTINSSINFFIYCLFNATFREEIFRWWTETLVRHPTAMRVDDPSGQEEQEMRPLVNNANSNQDQTTTIVSQTAVVTVAKENNS